jgi:hypothetical protein
VPNIFQVTWTWTGFQGAPGYTNLFFLSSNGDATEASNVVTKSTVLWTGLKPVLPTAVNITMSEDIRLIDDQTGDLRNSFTYAGSPVVGGSAGAGAYSGPSGAVIRWITGQVHGKHLLVGRTFVVPMIGSAFGPTGQLASATVTTLATAADAMRTAPGPAFGIWGRPRAAKTVGGITRPALIGAWHPATSEAVPNKAAVLRSRRD